MTKSQLIHWSLKTANTAANHHPPLLALIYPKASRTNKDDSTECLIDARHSDLKNDPTPGKQRRCLHCYIDKHISSFY